MAQEAGREIVGRDDELTVLSVFLRAESEAVALLLEGEAGVGKTTIWRAGLTMALERSYRVLACQPIGAEVQLSYAALGDLLGEVLPTALPELPTPQRRALAAAVLLEDAGEVPPDRRAIALAVLGVLRILARSDPVLVAVDDVQWLDAASAAVLQYAARRLGDERIKLLVALRSAHRQAAVLRLDQALLPERLVRVQPGPLPIGALHRLLHLRLGMTLPRPTLLRLHDASGGNPFYALELARALQQRDRRLAHGQPLPVPATLNELVRDRLAGLPTRVHEVLLVAALLARPTVAAVAAGAASGDRAPADLEAAVAAGIVTLEGEEVRFTHPLLAAGISARVTPTHRRQVHRRLAGVVAGVEERARHLALGADGPDARVAAALDAAARDASARGAPGAAAELGEFAARLTPPRRGHDLQRRRFQAADNHLTSGEVVRARQLLEELVAALPRGGERADALLLLARASYDDFERAVALCEQAVEEAGADDLRAGRAHFLLGDCWAIRGEITRALIHLRTARRLLEPTGDPGLLVIVLSSLAALEDWAGQVTPGLLERALALAETVEARPVYEGPVVTLGRRRMYEDRPEEARAHLHAALDTAIAHGDEDSRVGVLLHLTELECRVGNWAQAAQHAAACLEISEQILLHQHDAALYAKALVEAHLGRVEGAREAAQQGLELAEAGYDEIFRIQNLSVLGFLELSLGNPAEAAQLLRPLPARLTTLGWREPTVYPVWPNAIEALVTTGEMDQARAYIAEFEERAQAYGRPWGLATAARCRGLLHAADGDLLAALAAFERALKAHERVPGQFERGRTLLALGMTQRRAKQKRAARASLQQALAAFEQLGASLWAAKAQAELGRIGGRAAAAPQLTPTEERVAALVAEGRTNKEVAAALFVTVHTVEANLSRIYSKLGVRSRAELAHRLATGHTASGGSSSGKL
jgi:DNA-binding CsgD family transcriptional regulator/TolA-binding protein